MFIIFSGGSQNIEKHEHIKKFKEETGCTSVMIARAAEWNCSIFRKEGMLPLDEVITEYLKLAIEYDNSPSNSKYCIQNMLRELQETPRGKKFLACQTLEQIWYFFCKIIIKYLNSIEFYIPFIFISAIWNLDAYCREKKLEFQSKGIQDRWQVCPEALEPPNKKTKTQNILEGVMQKKVF